MKEIFSKIGKAVKAETESYYTNFITDAGKAEVSLYELKNFLNDFQKCFVTSKDILKAERELKGEKANIINALSFILDYQADRDKLNILYYVIENALTQYKQENPKDALTE